MKVVELVQWGPQFTPGVTFDEGRRLLTAAVWSGITVRLVACVRHDSGRLEHVGTLFIDDHPEAVALALAVIRGQCPPPVLADWIDDHPGAWRAPGPERDAAVREICERLRAA